MFSFLKNEILIDVAEDSFTFTKDDKSIDIKTVMWLSNDSKLIVLEIGKDYYGPTPAKKFSIFDKETNESLMELRAQSFLKYGIGKILEGTFILSRPKVTFKNSARLKDVLVGKEREFLISTAKAAGARAVEFI